MKKQLLLFILGPVISCFSFSQSEPDKVNIRSNTGARYVSGEDGIICMYMNVWEHIASPGGILVDDGIE